MIDICETENTQINGTVHLIATDMANSYTECQCFVTRSTFTLFLNDVRLHTSEESTCSATKLKINNIYYSCDNSSGLFGSHFKARIGDMIPMVFISVVLDVPPQMIWLTIHSSGKNNLTRTIAKCVYRNRGVEVRLGVRNDKKILSSTM